MVIFGQLAGALRLRMRFVLLILCLLTLSDSGRILAQPPSITGFTHSSERMGVPLVGSGSVPAGFTVGPTVSGFSPSSGSFGTSVSIDGANFTGATAVKFNGTAAGFTVASDTSITTTVPVGARSGPITVISSSGKGTSPVNFVVGPVISSFTPTSGSFGTSVTINGKNFTGATSVQFNRLTASYSVVSDTSITTFVPVGAKSGPITVTTSSGTGTSPIDFTVGPLITGFTPGSGSFGTPVTISGKSFTGATAVKFGGFAASYSVVSDTSITTFVPVGAKSGPITVITPSGTAISPTDFAVGPTITSFAPQSGSFGTPVTITGKNFTGTTSVQFSGLGASYSVVSDTTITTFVPTGATSGPVTVTTAAGTAISPTNFKVGPTITSFTPGSGSFGTPVTITGTGFTGATAVKFGGFAASYSVASDTTITAFVPVGAKSGPITVKTSSGIATSPTDFAVGPTITSFTPKSGSFGTPVTVTGKNFTGTTSVKFGGLAASYSVVSDTTITAFVPTGATSGPISVTTPSGTAISPVDFEVGPTITSFTPTSGSFGTPVTITGTGFTGATAVKFDGFAASYSVVSDTTITTFVPKGAKSGPITVKTSSGTAVSPTDFAVGPIISSFTPVSGAFGTSVTITGKNFTGATSVKFSGLGASYSVVSDTSITALVPVGATSGPISVTTSSGTAISPVDFGVGPTITSFTPTSGSFGTPVTITGTGFTGATAVKFGGFAALYSVVSDTTITTFVPAGAKSGPITVKTSSGIAISPIDFGVGPTITNFTPQSGSFGTPVTITGKNFTGATSVKFNGLEGSYFVVSDAKITTFVPTGATSGPVTVVTPSGTATSSGGFASPGAIAGFSPISGSAGTVVTISGFNFTGATSVKFHGFAANLFTIASDTTIFATVPAGATTGPITVVTPSGVGSSFDPFSVGPSIAGFAPIAGPAGITVTITGKNFDGATGVTFNGVPALSFTILSAVTIAATVPDGATTGPISVTTPSGVETSAFSFAVISGITSFTPMSGPIGTAVTITGTGFTGATSVKFHGIPAAVYSVDSDTSITAIVPTRATTGQISVVTPSGSGLSVDSFTITTGIASTVDMLPSPLIWDVKDVIDGTLPMPSQNKWPLQKA